VVYLSLIIIKLVTPELARHESQHLCSSRAPPPQHIERPGPLQSLCSEKLRSERGVTYTWMLREGRDAEPAWCQRKDSTAEKHVCMNRYLQLHVPQANAQAETELHGH